MAKKSVIGLPCVGGKSYLAPTLCKTLESYAKRAGIDKICDVCGGGGKIAFSLDKNVFNKIIYNDYEYGLAHLMQLLESGENVLKITNRLHRIIDCVLTMDDSVDEKTACYSLFKVANHIAVRGYNESLDIDPITLSALTVIVIFGSVQNGRMGIYYNKTDHVLPAGFLRNLYYKDSFFSNLAEIYRHYSHIKCINADCFDIVEQLSSRSDVLIFADIPYWGCKNTYHNDWTYEMHLKFVETCMKSKSKIMICMHEASLAPYFSLCAEKNWHCYYSGKIVHASKKTYLDSRFTVKLGTDENTDKCVDKSTDMSVDASTVKNSDEKIIDLTKELPKSMAVIEYILQSEGSSLSTEYKKAQEYVWCNFELTELKEAHFSRDVVSAELRNSVEHIEYENKQRAKRRIKPISFSEFEKKLMQKLGV